MKLNKIALTIAISSLLASCANLDDSHNQSEKTFQEYAQITQQFKLTQDWWTLYQDPELNQLVDLALKNNKDLAKSAIAVNLALYKANLVSESLVPNFVGSTTSKAGKNIKVGGSSQISHNATLQVGYTLDLWGKLHNQTSAARWAHSASVEDLHAAKLALINGVVTAYYQLAYLQEAIQITEQTVEDYRQINRIMLNKKAQGIVDGASTNQTQQAVLNAENSLSQLKNSQKVTQGMLRNLLNLKPSDPLPVKLPNLLTTNIAGVNLDVPLSVIANRPDVKGKLFRLHSAFKDAKATQKSWFPSVTLGGSLSSTGNKVGNSTHTPLAGGVLTIDLPFLSWNTVRWNVKVSEAQYNLAKLNFEQNITSALNEIDKNYFAYQEAQKQFINEEGIYKSASYMANYYKNRYNAGVTELRDWLSAKNTENASKLALLSAKNNLIQSENAVYSAMGGYYSK